MKKLVVFDLDGTLLNTIADLGAAANHALRRHGYAEHPMEAYPFMVGNGILKLLQRTLPAGKQTQEEALRLRADFCAYYDLHGTEQTHPYPGIEMLLLQLQAEGLSLAVASNKYQQATEALIATYFSGYPFVAVLGQREGVPVKPDPSIVHEIIRQAAVAAAEVLYVGDSGVDMQTARNAGVEAVGVTWGFRPRQELEEYGASYIVNTPQEIVAIAKQK